MACSELNSAVNAAIKEFASNRSPFPPRQHIFPRFSIIHYTLNKNGLVTTEIALRLARYKSRREDHYVLLLQHKYLNIY